MPRRDLAQIELRRLPLLRHANRGLALDRFADLARRGDIAFNGLPLWPGFHGMRPFVFGLRLAIVCFFQC